jgi:hypothetical protein
MKPPLRSSQANKENMSRSTHVTPKKNNLRHEFSTIKEVTECDEDCSENKMLSSFKKEEVEPREPRYEGELRNGRKEGFGKCFFPEGSKYEGEWHDDQMHGFGQLYYSNGTIAYKGQWAHNEFHGTGKVYCLKPSPLGPHFDCRDFNQLEEEWMTYEGALSRDKKHGLGVLILSNGERYEGQFNEDHIEGKGTFFRSNGTVLAGIWAKGRLV